VEFGNILRAGGVPTKVPVQNFVDPFHHVVISMCSGRVTREEFFCVFLELMRHPEFKPEFRQLISLSEVTAFEPSYRDQSAIREN